MSIQKSRLTLASAAVLFAFANGATMASAYAADQGTQEVAPRRLAARTRRARSHSHPEP